MEDPAAALRLVLANQALFVVFAIAGAILAGPRLLPHGLLLRRGTLGFGRSAVLIVGFVILSHAMSLILARLQWSETGTLAELGRIVGEMKVGPAPDLLLVVTALGIAPAFGEELLFRGLLQQLARHWLPTGAAVLLSALLFGLLHFDLAQSSAAFLMGVYLGLAVERSGSLVCAIVAHGLNNTLGILLPANTLAPLAASGHLVGGIGLAVSALLLALALRPPRPGPGPSPEPAPPGGS